MAKLFRNFFCLLLFFFFASGIFPVDAVDSVTDFDIVVTGNKIPNTDFYANDATITLQPKSDSGELSAFINYNGIWMKLPDRQKNGFQISFAKDGDYSYQFRIEDSRTKTSTIKQIYFSIDGQLAKLVDEVNALPNLNTATDEMVAKNKALILSLKRKYNQLSSEQRLRFPSLTKHTLTALYQWLANIEPSVHYREPEPPAITVNSALPAVKDIYSGPVTITILPKDTWNLHAVLININGSWQALQKDQNNRYTLTLTDEKAYHLDVCIQDQNSNISESASTDVSVDAAIYQIVSETERLYSQAAVMSKEAYLTALENTYLQYLSASPSQQFKIPADSISMLESMYANALNQYGVSNIAYDEKGNFLKAYGMLTRLKTPPGTSHINFTGDRVNRIVFGRAAPNQNVKAEYQLAFYSANGDPASFQIQDNAPMLFYIQVPEDLKGKQNIDLLYMKDGNYVSAGAKVRSTKDGLVMVFRSYATGSYVFVCDK